MTHRHSLRDNLLLAALPADAVTRLRPHLEPVDMAFGDVLCEPGRNQAYLYFPSDCIVSLLYVMENGNTAEIALVGNEGVIGVAAFVGGLTMSSRAVVQSAGAGFRIKADALCEEFQRAGALQRLLLRYVQALLTQVGQTAVCNRHHAVEQQLCRWLLMSMDRLPDGELPLTQELIASMLGVRREGISEAAGRLQRSGIISYRRGRISVLDRARLEDMSCECYATVRNEAARLLPGHDDASVPGGHAP